MDGAGQLERILQAGGLGSSPWGLAPTHTVLPPSALSDSMAKKRQIMPKKAKKNHTAAVLWRKSSFSASGSCIEVAIQNDSVLIRDTKNRSRGTISASSSAWQELIQAIQDNKTI